MIETQRPFHILIVEDNRLHAELIELAMASAHIDNPRVRVPTGEQALALLRERAADHLQYQFGLVLLDVKLPGMSGLDTLKEIRADQDLKYLPVVMLTTSMNDRDRVLAYEFSVNSYVSKPLDFAKFEKVIQDLGCYWCFHNTPRSTLDAA